MREQHFYHLDGRPCYEIVGANGNPRSATIADARKGRDGQFPAYGICPSVTQVIRSAGYSWPMVEDQLVECARTAYRLGVPPRGEEETYVAQCVYEARKYVGEAAHLGTRIHDAIYLALKGEYPADADIEYCDLIDEADRLYLKPVWRLWASANLVLDKGEVERSLCNGVIGGKIDWLGPTRITPNQAIVDWKSSAQEWPGGDRGRADFRDDWAEQLAGYEELLGLYGQLDWVSVIISTNPDTLGQVAHKVWSEDEKERARAMWSAKLAYFRAMKHWYPEKHRAELQQGDPDRASDPRPAD